MSWPKVVSCSPRFTAIFVLSFGSGRSASAQPLYSRAISSADGCLGIAYGQVSFRIGSGNAPPSFA